MWKFTQSFQDFGYFPYSLSTSVLLSNLCWEFVMAWNKDIKQLEALEAALNVLPLIPVKRVRHGKLKNI